MYQRVLEEQNGDPGHSPTSISDQSRQDRGLEGR